MYQTPGMMKKKKQKKHIATVRTVCSVLKYLNISRKKLAGVERVQRPALELEEMWKNFH